MIRVLAREQWRFQRMYIVWAAAIVAAAVGFATFATLSAATQGVLDSYENRMLLNTAPHNAPVLLNDPGFYVPEPAEDWGTPMTSADLGDLVDRANADGAGAVASVTVYVDLALTEGTYPETPALSQLPTIRAVWGDADWDAILVAGAAPGPRGIVLPARTARELDVGIGDTVLIGHTVTESNGDFGFASDAALTVSGLAYDDSHEGYNTGQAYTSREQVQALAAAYQGYNGIDGRSLMQATIGWERPSHELDELRGTWDNHRARTFGSTGALPWLLAALFTAGAIVTAFTLGRGQAQSRAKWVATARALGAKRAHLLGVAGLEWALVGAAGAAAGIGLGWAGAVWAHAHDMASRVAAPPVGLSFPLFVAGLMLALTALLAGAVVAVPSVFAMRVPPTAALKETAAADAAHLSRRVKFWPAAVIFLATWLATVLLTYSQADSVGPYLALCALGAVASGIAVLVETCRALVRATASRLARSHRPWALHASMTMTGHPQQATALAIIQALVFTSTGGFVISAQPYIGSFGWFAYQPVSSMISYQGAAGFLREVIPAPLATTTVIAVLVAVQFLVVVIAASSRRVAWNESSTAGALGLTRSTAARGDAFAWWVAQAHGTWVGACVGIASIGAIWLANWTSAPDYFGGTDANTVSTLLGLLPWRIAGVASVGALSLAIAAIVAAAAAVVLRPRHDARRAHTPA